MTCSWQSGRCRQLDITAYSQLVRLCPLLRTAPPLLVTPRRGAEAGSLLAKAAPLLRQLELRIKCMRLADVDDITPISWALTTLSDATSVGLAFSGTRELRAAPLLRALASLPRLQELRLSMQSGEQLLDALPASQGRAITSVTSLHLSL